MKQMVSLSSLSTSKGKKIKSSESRVAMTSEVSDILPKAVWMVLALTLLLHMSSSNVLGRVQGIYMAAF